MPPLRFLAGVERSEFKAAWHKLMQDEYFVHKKKHCNVRCCETASRPVAGKWL